MTSRNPGFMAVALAAGAVFALGLGVRQSQALFIGPINSSTGLGYASVTLAFAIGSARGVVVVIDAANVAQRIVRFGLAGAVADRSGGLEHGLI